MDEMIELAKWFGSNTQVVSVDTAIQAKDRFDIIERERLKARAAHLLAAKLIDSELVATTVVRAPKGDIIRLQVQCVRPEIWCEAHEKVFTAPAEPSNELVLGDAQ
jgi:gluconate kinase